MKQKFLLIIVFCLLTAAVSAQTEEARKIDEYSNANCEDYLARTDAMIQMQANNPDSKIYVFIYEGKEKKPVYKKGNLVDSKSLLPQYGLAKVRIESVKKYLTTKKISLDNYVFVNGGFRKTFWVEIWLASNSAEPPKPTPTVEKMKYRKGRPAGFCLVCCVQL